jgi:hypothetical protein
VDEILKVITLETIEEGEARREKQQWEGYKADKRPLDEFFDVKSIESEYIPVDISDEKDGEFLKYVITQTTSKTNRFCETNDIVYYIHETRYGNGQLVDFDERRKVTDKYEMSNMKQSEFLRKSFFTMKKGEVVWLKIGSNYH